MAKRGAFKRGAALLRPLLILAAAAAACGGRTMEVHDAQQLLAAFEDPAVDTAVVVQDVLVQGSAAWAYDLGGRSASRFPLRRSSNLTIVGAADPGGKLQLDLGLTRSRVVVADGTWLVFVNLRIITANAREGGYAATGGAAPRVPPLAPDLPSPPHPPTHPPASDQVGEWGEGGWGWRVGVGGFVFSGHGRMAHGMRMAGHGRWGQRHRTTRTGGMAQNCSTFGRAL
jgi:hypothetical protein